MALTSVEMNSFLEKKTSFSINKEFENLKIEPFNKDMKLEDVINKIKPFADILTKLLKLFKIFTNNTNDKKLDNIIEVINYLVNHDTTVENPKFEELIIKFSENWPTLREILIFIKGFTGNKADKKIDIIIQLGDYLSKFDIE